MAELKTKQTKASVSAFLNQIKDASKRKDTKELLKIFKQATGLKPAMWGTSLIGFGSYHYTYKSKQEGDWPLTAFSPRKSGISIYIMPGFSTYTKELGKLGPHKTGVSCLYIKKLSDINIEILEKIIKDSVNKIQKIYPSKSK